MRRSNDRATNSFSHMQRLLIMIYLFLLTLSQPLMARNLRLTAYPADSANNTALQSSFVLEAVTVGMI